MKESAPSTVMPRRSLIPFPPTVAASASGLRPRPPQSAHGDSTINSRHRERTHALSVSRNLLSRMGSTPSNGAVFTHGRRPRQNRAVTVSFPEPRRTISRARASSRPNGTPASMPKRLATARRRER